MQSVPASLRALPVAVLLGAAALPAQQEPLRAPSGAPVQEYDELAGWMSDVDDVELHDDWVAYVGASGRHYQVVESLEGDFVTERLGVEFACRRAM